MGTSRIEIFIPAVTTITVVVVAVSAVIPVVATIPMAVIAVSDVSRCQTVVF